MKIYLLTHEREVQRPTNTGSIALSESGGLVRRVIWQRGHPDPELVELLEAGEAALVYPDSESGGTGEPVAAFDTFILLDGTWQEARKIYNRSPYLQEARRVSLDPEIESSYRLRRNQREGGLCTAECVIELLQAKGFDPVAEQLREEFRRFNLSKQGKKV